MTTENIAVNEATAAPVEQAADIAPNAEANAEGSESVPAEEADVPFPKKAVNALSRKDKQLGKYRFEVQQLREQLQQFQAVQTQANPSQPKNAQATAAPKVEDFGTFQEFLDASLDYRTEQKFSEHNKKNTEMQLKQQEQQYFAEREQHVATQAQELIEKNPEYGQLLQENADIIDAFPDKIQQAFLEADNAALAFVALAKEGKLDALATMSPARAAMEIAKAEMRGEALIKQKTATRAPAPINSVKGMGATEKSLQNKSIDELMKWVRA